jgi:predicted TIM-barrel fold metal-dependent hydrolase
MSYSIVDTHVHFWDLERFHYFWLKPEYGILNQTYLPDQIRAETGQSLCWQVPTPR